MRTRLAVFAATGIAGLALGAGIGVAVAETDDPPAPPRAGAMPFGSMDEMHAAMRAQMPDDLAAACDEMHASMPEEMRDMGAMGDMGAMRGMGGMGGGMGAGHARHHG
jgi:hypothetical protein